MDAPESQAHYVNTAKIRQGVDQRRIGHLASEDVTISARDLLFSCYIEPLRLYFQLFHNLICHT